MKHKKAIALLMSTVILAAVAGCAQTAPAAAEPSQPEVAESAEAEEPAAEAEVEQEKPAIFVIRGVSNRESKTDNAKVKALIEERSGVKFDVIVVPVSSWDEKINALIASDEPMDIINITQNDGNWSKYLEKNAIVPYGDLVEKYFPNILEKASDAKSWESCYASDGSLYAIPREERWTKGNSPVIREDWLEALGMENPTNMEELEAVFQAVLDNDLNGNGIQDEIPYMPGYNSFIKTFRPYYLGFHGEKYLDEEGNIMPWYMHPNCWEMLKKAQEWYEKGYLYPEYITTTIEQVFDIAGADRIFMYTGWYNNTIAPSASIKEANPDSPISWTALNNLSDAPGISAWPANPKNTAELVLSRTAQEPEAALKLMNWILDDVDNWMLCAYGIEGEHWQWVEEGKTFQLLPGAFDAYNLEYLLTEWFGEDAPVQVAYEGDYVRGTAYKLENEINETETTYAFDYYVPYSVVGTEAEMLTDDAATFIDEATTRVIYGEYSEEDWNAAVQQAWEIDGQIRSKVWTEQYHNAVD